MRYPVICVDPPWRFANWQTKASAARSTLHHYALMSDEDIKALPVGDYAARDCCLFLWTIDTSLPIALEVLEAWGFAYKTVGFCWGKLNKNGSVFKGCGWWTRANQELCLLATRGQPKRRAKDVGRLVMAERREHSRKPDEVYQRIERLCDGPYLELFARTRRPGWDVALSDQADLFDLA